MPVAHMTKRVGRTRWSLVRWFMLGCAGLVGCAAVLLYMLWFGAVVDCRWSGTAKAWIDENKNGVWEANESPLPGARFLIDDTKNGDTDVGPEALSNEEGEAA